MGGDNNTINTCIVTPVLLQVREKVESMFKFGVEELMVHWEDVNGIVYVCGLAAKVDEFLDVLRQTKTTLEDQLAKSKQRIEERISLKPHQIFLLKTFSPGGQYAGREVAVKMTGSEVVLVGQLKDVQLVKLEILQKASSMTSSSFQCWSQAVRKLVEKPDVKRHFHGLFKNEKFEAALDIGNGEVTVHGFNQSHAQQALQLVKGEVRETTVTVHKRSVGFFRSRTWNEFLSDTSKEFKLTDVAVSECTITITAVDHLERTLEKKVKEFLDSSVEVKDFFPMKPAVAKLLHDMEMDKINRLRQQMKQFKLDLHFEGDSGCHFNVVLGGLQKAKNELKALVDSVKMKTHTVEKKSHVKYLENQSNREVVKAIAIRTKVVINFPDEEMAQTVATAAQKSDRFDPYVFSEVDFGRGKKIRLVVGDITRYSSDVMVNAANSRLTPALGVAGAIARAGMYVVIVLFERLIFDCQFREDSN